VKLKSDIPNAKLRFKFLVGVLELSNPLLKLRLILQGYWRLLGVFWLVSSCPKYTMPGGVGGNLIPK
jgi:hypothetical protein